MTTVGCPNCGQPLNRVISHCSEPAGCGWSWHVLCGALVDMTKPSRFNVYPTKETP